MRVEKKSMNWLPKPSLYDDQQRKSAWLKNRAKLYLNESSSLASAFQSAFDTVRNKQTEQAVTTAVDRIKKAASAKLNNTADKLNSVLSGIDKSA